MTEAEEKKSLDVNLKNIVLALILTGGIGTGSGALSTKLFNDDTDTLDKIQASMETLTDSVDSQDRKLDAFLSANLEMRVKSLEERVGELEDDDKDFWKTEWPDLNEKISDMSAKIDTLVARGGMREF